MGGAANQALLPHGVGLVQKSEGSGRSDLCPVVSIREVNPESLFSDQGMGEIDGIRHGIGIGRIHGNKLVPFPHLQLPAHAQVGSGSSLFANADFEDGLDKGQGTAVEDGQLKVIQLNDGIVDATTDQGGEKVLGGGNQHALFHQAGGVTDPSDISAHGLQFKAVEIGAAKN